LQTKLTRCLLIAFEGVGQATFSAIVAVEVLGHENGSSTVGAFTTQSGDFTIIVNLVASEDCKLDLLGLMLGLLWLRVVLFLAFLASSTKSQDEMKSRFLLDIVVAESAPIFELLSSEDKTLLIGGDAFLVLDLGLHVFDGIGWFDIKSDGLTRQGFHEDLHDCKQSVL